MNARPLSDLEKKIIEEILSQTSTVTTYKDNEAVAYAVWESEDGTDIDFGPVRWGHRNNIIRNEGPRVHSLSCSPFPGAWAMIPIDKIIRIRHGKAF